MQIQVRDQVLDIWRSVISFSQRNGDWQWGGRSGSNSISDAEQLLTILYPATNVPSFRFDRPDETAADVRDALRALGTELDAPERIVDLISEFVVKYRSPEGYPIFPAGQYIDTDSAFDATPEQRELEVVDSFSMSVTLMLSAIGFIRVLTEHSMNLALQSKMTETMRLCSERLTGAMTGLLRSFSVNVFGPQSDEGLNLLSMLNQAAEPHRAVVARLSLLLADVRASLQKELSIGSGVSAAEALADQTLLFQPGWSWGVVDGAPRIGYIPSEGGQQPGVADDRPYLYFTGVAMDGIQDLFSDRTRILALLDEDQQRLAGALRLRWDLTLRFWNRVALFGEARRWPLEDLPWRTTDGLETDYYSLLMASMVVQGYDQLAEPSEDDVARTGVVLDQLARRGRITLRVGTGDPAYDVHAPGMKLKLIGSEKYGQDQQEWTVSSYSSLLLKRVLTVAGLANDTAVRDDLNLLSGEIWEHLVRRRFDLAEAENLWDQPSLVYPVRRWDGPSWYHTERVMECLVVAAGVIEAPVRVSPDLTRMSEELLAEAEHLFDREKLHGTGQAGRSMRQRFDEVEDRLNRARELTRRQPGTAKALLEQVLLELDDLAVARLDPQGTG